VKKTSLQSLGLCRLGHEYCNSIFSKKRLTTASRRAGKGKQQRISTEDAIQHAASLIQDSSKPLFLGWSNSTQEAIQLGLKLAQHSKGVFDSTASIEYGKLLGAKLQGGESGQVNLDEVRDFADHIVYWGVNPAESHHRHASRYTVFPRGKNIPEGRESRVVSVLDVRKTESMGLANHQLILSPTIGDMEFLQTLIAELKGKQQALAEQVGGVPTIEFLSFSKQLREAETIALFYGNGLLHATHSPKSLPLLAQLNKALNRGKRRCWTLPMVAYCNTIGSVKASLNSSKIPFAVDFSVNPPQSVPSIPKALTKEKFDSVIIANWDALSFLPGPTVKAISQLPIIALSTHPTLTTKKANIVFPLALTGAETQGTVYRMDGTAVPLKPFKESPKGVLTEEQLHGQLLKAIG
jgi:formylmethanofuran dehydrogenase subunit B